MADMSAYQNFDLGESKARTILIIGYYQEDLGIGYATYEDIVALSGRSLSRARNIINEMLKDDKLKDLIEIEKSGKSVKIRLTPKGLEIYHSLKNALQKAEVRLEASNLVKEFDNLIYRDTKAKTITDNNSRIRILIDYQVPYLKLPDLVNRIIRETRNGQQLLVGVAIELANAAQINAMEHDRSILSDLARTIINSPIHISRTLDVSLPPHIYASPMDIENIRNKISLFSVWTRGVSENDIINYAKEGEAYGIIKLYSSKTSKDFIVEPIAGTGIDAVAKLVRRGFEIIASIPSRAWLPALSIYADITSSFPTVDEILSGEGELTKLLKEHIGNERYERWARHMLGLQRIMKTRNLIELGAIDIFDVNGEKRVLSLTAARHILRVNQSEESLINTKNMMKEAEERIKKILEDGGNIAKIVLEVIRRGFMQNDELDKLISKIINSNDSSEISKMKWTIQKLGFIAPVGTGYYSAWTISPIFEQEDETLRAIYIWADREVSQVPQNFQSVMQEILQKLIENEAISIASFAGNDIRSIARLSSIFTRLENMGLVHFDKDNLNVKLNNKPRSKIILQVALIEKMLGVNLMSLEPKKGDVGDIISSLIEVGRKGV